MGTAQGSSSRARRGRRRAGIALGARAATSSTPAASTTHTTQQVTTTRQTTTQQTATTATAAATTTTTVAPPPKTPSSRFTQWPDRSAWTEVLVSIPAAGGHAQAVAEANRAVRAGLDAVGVLLSARHRSLHAGYWVVFAGIYESAGQAQGALAAVRARGFPQAYPRFVSS